MTVSLPITSWKSLLQTLQDCQQLLFSLSVTVESESVSHSVVSDSVTPWSVALQTPRPWDPPARILEWVAMPFSRRSS